MSKSQEVSLHGKFVGSLVGSPCDLARKHRGRQPKTCNMLRMLPPEMNIKILDECERQEWTPRPSPVDPGVVFNTVPDTVGLLHNWMSERDALKRSAMDVAISMSTEHNRRSDSTAWFRRWLCQQTVENQEGGATQLRKIAPGSPRFPTAFKLFFERPSDESAATPRERGRYTVCHHTLGSIVFSVPAPHEPVCITVVQLQSIDRKEHTKLARAIAAYFSRVTEDGTFRVGDVAKALCIGVRDAVSVCKHLREANGDLRVMRLDSGPYKETSCFEIVSSKTIIVIAAFPINLLKNPGTGAASELLRLLRWIKDKAGKTASVPESFLALAPPATEAFERCVIASIKALHPHLQTPQLVVKYASFALHVGHPVGHFGHTAESHQQHLDLVRSACEQYLMLCARYKKRKRQDDSHPPTEAAKE